MIGHLIEQRFERQAATEKKVPDVVALCVSQIHYAILS
jgi:hypothetical protein